MGTEPKLRYVVLRHEGVPEPHFDLMIENETGGALWTWRLGEWPPSLGAKLQPLADHRREYLEYEGPVSNDRGWVKRVSTGLCDLAISPSSKISVSLHSESELSFIMELVRASNQWQVIELNKG
jgi:hypothetical protein